MAAFQNNNTILIGSISGVAYGTNATTIGTPNYASGLKIARVVKIDNDDASATYGQLQNLDGSVTPSLAGVVLRTTQADVAYPDEFNYTDKYNAEPASIAYLKSGLVTIDLTDDSDEPIVNSQVYIRNFAGDVENGKAQATATNAIAYANAVFIEKKASKVWLIKLV